MSVEDTQHDTTLQPRLQDREEDCEWPDEPYVERSDDVLAQSFTSQGSSTHDWERVDAPAIEAPLVGNKEVSEPRLGSPTADNGGRTSFTLGSARATTFDQRPPVQDDHMEGASSAGGGVRDSPTSSSITHPLPDLPAREESSFAQPSSPAATATITEPNAPQEGAEDINLPTAQQGATSGAGPVETAGAIDFPAHDQARTHSEVHPTQSAPDKPVAPPAWCSPSAIARGQQFLALNLDRGGAGGQAASEAYAVSHHRSRYRGGGHRDSDGPEQGPVADDGASSLETGWPSPQRQLAWRRSQLATVRSSTEPIAPPGPPGEGTQPRLQVASKGLRPKSSLNPEAPEFVPKSIFAEKSAPRSQTPMIGEVSPRTDGTRGRGAAPNPSPASLSNNLREPQSLHVNRGVPASFSPPLLLNRWLGEDADPESRDYEFNPGWWWRCDLRATSVLGKTVVPPGPRATTTTPTAMARLRTPDKARRARSSTPRSRRSGMRAITSRILPRRQTSTRRDLLAAPITQVAVDTRLSSS